MLTNFYNILIIKLVNYRPESRFLFVYLIYTTTNLRLFHHTHTFILAETNTMEYALSSRQTQNRPTHSNTSICPASVFVASMWLEALVRLYKDNMGYDSPKVRGIWTARQ